MIWVISISVHLFSIIVYTILLRKSHTNDMDNAFKAALMSTAVWIPSFIFLFIGKVDFNLTIKQILFLILGGLMVSGLVITNVWAISHLDASMFTIIYNIRLFMTTIFGFVILSELPTVWQMIGGLIILCSILMLNLHIDSRWKSKAILIGFFSMMWFSVHTTIEKYNLKHVKIETYLFIFLGLGTLFSWSMVILKNVDIKKQLIHLKDKTMIWMLVTRSLSGYGYVYALKYGGIAISNYISGMSVVFIVLFGIYFLGERNDIKQKFGATAIALIGMTIIMVSKVMAG